MRKSLILFASMMAVSAFADAKIDLVASDLRALSRIAALADSLNNTRQVMLAIVDNDIENLREKRTDGTYRWASLQREEASRVKDQKSIERVQTEKQLREVTLSAPMRIASRSLSRPNRASSRRTIASISGT